MDAQTLSKAMGGALSLAAVVAVRSGTASAPTAPLFIFTPAPHR